MRRQNPRGRVLGMLLALALACDKPAPPPGNDTSAPQPPPPSPVAPQVRAPETAWDASAGPVFLVIGPNATTASVVFPEVAADAEVDAQTLNATPYVGRSFELLGNGRVIGAATIAAVVPVDAPEECSGWPLVQLTGVPGDTAHRSWVVAFETARVQPVAVDSLTALSGSDSSRLAMEVARIATAVPADTTAALRGLPYRVRRAYRFAVAPGVEGVLAEVVRSLNQEASPLQEHLLLIAERDSASGGRYELAYSERAAGTEDVLESTEPLAIVRPSPTREVAVLLARYVGDGVVYALLERVSGRRWRQRWSSPYVGC